MQDQSLYSIPEAAKILSVCRQTMHRWILEGRIREDKFWRFGKNYKIDKLYINSIKLGKIELMPRQRAVY